MSSPTAPSSFLSLAPEQARPSSTLAAPAPKPVETPDRIRRSSSVSSAGSDSTAASAAAPLLATVQEGSKTKFLKLNTATGDWVEAIAEE